MFNGPIDTNSANSASSASSGAGCCRPACRELLRGTERDQRALWHFQYFELQIVRSQGLKPLLHLLLQQSLDYFELDQISLLLLDPNDTLRGIAVESIGEIPEKLELTTDAGQLHALFPGGVKVREQSASLDPAALDAGNVPGIAILLPLVWQGQLMGSLQLSATEGSRLQQYQSNDRLTHFAAVVAVCIENCINRERLRMHSLIDALTGVRNRRGFEEFLQSEVARAVRTRLPVAAIFIDLDHFKRVNDHYGHLCGDRVLQEVAGNISEVLRPTDLLSRYGGEEFVALLPNCDNSQAGGIARRINLSVAALDLFDDKGQLFHISCSVGYSAWLEPGERDLDTAVMAQSLIAQADKAVYQAKREGRDRVCYVALQDCPRPCV